MAGLRARLTRLEGRQGADTTAQDADSLLDRLGALGARVEAGGDFADNPGAAPAERYLRAVMRGDGATAEAIIDKAARGQA